MLQILNILLAAMAAMTLGLDSLHQEGYTGQGITIAIIDGGFYASDSIYGSHIIDSFDLYEPDTTHHYLSMFRDPQDNHGTCCLSTIVGQRTDEHGILRYGTAPDAQVYLIRSEERVPEHIHEAERLARAIYLADSLDVDIISISLGYRTFDDTTTNYSYAQMDGSTIASQAAEDVGTRRIICVAAGNDGNKDWHYIGTPADARNVLTVGAVDQNGIGADFSSWGPTSDGRQKPEVSAWGRQTWINDGRIWKQGNGTSFATPEIAGLCACLRQALPDTPIDHLRELIIQSCDHYEQPDYKIGYGVPNAQRVLELAREEHRDTTGHIVPTDPEGWSKTNRSHSARKIMRYGQLILMIDGQKYDLFGKRIEQN